MEEVGHAFGRGVDFEPGGQSGVLRRDADRAAAGMAVMASILRLMAW